RMERLHHVLGLKHRRVDRLLQAHAVMHEAQENAERPLLLLIAAWCAECQIWLAATRDEGRRERDAWTRSAAQRRRMAILQPAHLPARRDRKPEARHHRRSLQPAAGWRRRYHVAGRIDDIAMHGVAPFVRKSCKCRF